MKRSTDRTRELTIIAQDPSVKDFSGKILKTQIRIPAEELARGPRGYRVTVVDFDTSTNSFYRSDCDYEQARGDDPIEYLDPFKQPADDGDDDALLSDPRFHCQNVYAIIMRILARFEFALGRRVDWGFNGHQIHVAPHAFADPNAFYAERERALCFGYFRGSGVTRPNNDIIFTSLSHDVVAHEATHALLDGLRERYTDPSSPDQAAFHEGFSDVIALLSVFSLSDVVASLLPQIEGGVKGTRTNKRVKKKDIAYITKKYLTKEILRKSVLFGLADEMGDELSGIRGSALRRSVELAEGDPKTTKKSYLDNPEFEEPHRRGELMVAAVMNCFLDIWLKRVGDFSKERKANDKLDKTLIVDEGASAAEHLMTMMIRALDYAPPTDIRFGDFLSSVLTADADVVPDDSRYGYRESLLNNFAQFGIVPPPSANKDGTWVSCSSMSLRYERTHFESLLRDPTEVFRFIWDNRRELFDDDDYDGLPFEDAYTMVESVRPSVRIAPDGFAVRETVATYIQIINLRVDEIGRRLRGINLPKQMISELGRVEVRMYGGGNLIFDEYGKLKYHIRNRIYNAAKQSERLRYLWKAGYLGNAAYRENLFASMHMRRALGDRFRAEEQF